MYSVQADYLKLTPVERITTGSDIPPSLISTNPGCFLAFDGIFILHFAQFALISCLAEGGISLTTNHYGHKYTFTSSPHTPHSDK